MRSTTIRNHVAKALWSGKFRSQTVKSKKSYARQKYDIRQEWEDDTIDTLLEVLQEKEYE